MKEKIGIIMALIVIACGIAFVLVYRWGMTHPNEVPVVHHDGMIYHPEYGTYNEEVECEAGMTLMPGQSARGIGSFVMMIWGTGKTIGTPWGNQGNFKKGYMNE